MDGRTFTLEILEGLAVSRVEELNRQIRRLKEKGFRISIHHPDGQKPPHRHRCGGRGDGGLLQRIQPGAGHIQSGQ